MKQEVKLGVADRTVLVFIPDPASTDGSGKTGLVAANLTVSYTRVETDNDVVLVDATSSLSNLSALTDAHADWGLKEVSSTLAPGLYRLDLADAVFASGAWSAVVYVMITTSAAAPSPMEFILVAYDPLDTVRLGLTALPNAGANAAGGLVISDAGGLDADAQRADVAAILVDTGTTLDGRIPAALVSGRIDASVGAMAANVITSTVVADGTITNAKIADGALTAAKAAAGFFDAVWSVTARLLTAGTNIALAKGTGVTGFNDLDAADVRTAVGLATANLDTQLGDLPTNAELATSQAAADDATLAAIATLQTTADDIPTNAELATALGTADDAVLAQVALVKAKTDLIPASPAAVGDIPTANANADALLDRTAGVETNRTLRQATRLMLAVLCGKSSGLDTGSPIFRDTNDSANRVSATTDANGNRSAVTLNAA